MESFLESLKEQAKCYLCNNTLVKPKLFNCFHAFCAQCIRNNYFYATDEVERQDCILKCPVPQCDSETLLQCLNDVDSLHTSPLHLRILKDLKFLEKLKICTGLESRHDATWICLDCDEDPSLCDKCLHHHSKYQKNHKVVSFSELKKEDIDKVLKRELLCQNHHSNATVHCQDCDMPICDLCLKEHHPNHKTIATQEKIAIETDSLSKNLEQIDRIITNEQEKKEQQQIAMTVIKHGKTAEQEVIEFAQKLVTTIQKYEQQLLDEIQVKKSKAKRNLKIISNPTQAQEYIKNFVENSAASELIDIKNSKSFQNVTHYEPFNKTTSEMTFKPNEVLCEQVEHGLGLLRSFKKADPQMSCIKLPSDLEALWKAKLVVELKSSEGEVAKEPLENISIQFTPENDVKVEEIQMTDDGEITVDFIPRVPGQLTIDVKLHGNPVCESPLVMVVKPQQILEMTGQSKLKDALNIVSENFAGVTLNTANNTIAVSDDKSHLVRVYNMEGDLLLTYGSKAKGQGQLNSPHGLAFLSETDLVIVDSWNHRLCIINTTTGQLESTFGCQGDGNGQLKFPRGVHVDDDQNIIVCDTANDRVQVFTKDGDYLYQFRVLDPLCVVKHNGLFYVSTSGESSVVHVIKMTDNESLTTVTTIGGKDYTDGQLKWPYDLAIDNDDNILICDHVARSIYKFTLDGRSVGRSVKLATEPRYLAVLNDGRVICTTVGCGVAFFVN